MHRASRTVLHPAALAAFLLLAGSGVAAAADDTARRPSRPEASDPVVDRSIHVSDGKAFDELLRRSGVAEAEIEELTRRQRAQAIRRAYERGDRRSITQIEAQLPAGEIEAALSRRSEVPIDVQEQGSSYVWYSCGAGSGVTAQFKVFGSWSAYFETTGGSRTSTQTGHCGDFWNGCVITDSVSGNPAITWRFHYASAFQLGYHIGWCG